jgi:hypothetical protein
MNMALSFRSVLVEFETSGTGGGVFFGGLGRWGFGVKIHAADVAIKGFHIGYENNDDHAFLFQRIALHNVAIRDGDVHFDLFVALKDDTDDANFFKGTVEVLVIADVDFP